MKRKLCSLFLSFFCLWLLVLPVDALTSVYHPPMLTILTENAPEDLSIEFHLHRQDEPVIAKVMEKKTKAWEQQFRLYREAFISVRAWYGNHYDLMDAELVLISGGKRTTIPLPRELTDQMSMNDVLMLNYKTGTLTLGDPFWRGPLLMILRILVALGLEILIFRLRGYTERRSYLLVGITTLLSFGVLSSFTSHWLNFNIREIIAYAVFALTALLAQLLVYLLFVEEDSRDRTLITTLFAVFLAIVSNVLMLRFLPI